MHNKLYALGSFFLLSLPVCALATCRKDDASPKPVVAMGDQVVPVVADERGFTPAAVENALRVLLAIGGSTNAIIHLTAIAGRLGIPVSLTRLNELSIFCH